MSERDAGENIIRQLDHERSESPARGENLVESDGLEQHKNSLPGFLGRVSTKLKCAKACLVELKYDELESALKDLSSAWKKYDNCYSFCDERVAARRI